MCADHINDMWKWLPAVGAFAMLFLLGKQWKTAENNKEQQTYSLFFRCRNRQRPRVSADDAMSFAVILREIQRKQRERPDGVGDQASPLAQSAGLGWRYEHRERPRQDRQGLVPHIRARRGPGGARGNGRSPDRTSAARHVGAAS